MHRVPLLLLLLTAAAAPPPGDTGGASPRAALAPPLVARLSDDALFGVADPAILVIPARFGTPDPTE